MRGRVTKRAVDAMKGAGYLWDSDVPGFGCKATPAGKKVYIFQYRPRAQAEKSATAPKRVTLGPHGPITADAARPLAAKLLLEVRSGGDPAAHFRAGDSPTISALMERFLTEYLPQKKRAPR